MTEVDFWGRAGSKLQVDIYPPQHEWHLPTRGELVPQGPVNQSRGFAPGSQG